MCPKLYQVIGITFLKQSRNKIFVCAFLEILDSNLTHIIYKAIDIILASRLRPPCMKICAESLFNINIKLYQLTKPTAYEYCNTYISSSLMLGSNLSDDFTTQIIRLLPTSDKRGSKVSTNSAKQVFSKNFSVFFLMISSPLCC